MTTLVVIALAITALTFVLRLQLTRRGSGRLAQVAFRREHGETVARLLDGEVDPRPHSPWIAIQVDGRPARMVAAPLAGRMQAGIELFEREIPVDVWHTSGEREELEIPDGIDESAVLAIVSQLRAADVVSCVGGLMRIDFDDVAELPDRIARIAPLLTALEDLRALDESGEHGVGERN